MGSTFYSLHYHVIFSTKDRRPLIRPAWRPHLHQYLGGTIRGLGGVAEIVGGVEDHVHVLMSVRTTDTPADLVREFKKASSIWAGVSAGAWIAWVAPLLFISAYPSVYFALFRSDASMAELARPGAWRSGAATAP